MERFATKLALLVVLTLASLSNLAQAPPEGHWEGAIDLPGTKLGIDVDLAQEEGAWAGDISIPLQGAKDLPLASITIDGTTVAFAISGVPGNPVFRGALSADGSSISGDFTQGGQTFRFMLERAASPATEAGTALEGFDAFVEDALEAWNAPGLAIGIVRDGEIVYAKGFGYRDLEKKLPVTTDTLFAIGSSTKAFTVFTIGTLVDEGRVDWDQPVRNYIPEFALKDPFASDNITVRDLVTHRSGLPRHDLLWYNNQHVERSELVERLRYLEPNAGLREKYQYNNLMFLTAGYLVEKITGSSWEDAVRARVLGPIGMARTNFSVSESQTSDDCALPYRDDDDELKRIPFRVIDAMGPAGSINSSVNDMLKWIGVHLSGGKVDGKQIINPSTLADMHTPHMVTGERAEKPRISPASYGMGWFVESYRGHREVQHGGAIDGFIARISLYPDDGLGIVALTNSGNPLPTLMTRHAVDLVLGLDPIDWNGEALAERALGKELEKESEAKKSVAKRPGTKPAHSLDEYAGDYSHPGYGRMTIRRDGARLTMEYNNIRNPFEHWHYEVFNGLETEDPTFEDMKIMFRSNLDGFVASVNVPMDPFVDPIVFDKMPDPILSDPDHLEKLEGEYVLGPQLITFSAKGTTLFADIPGQPTYELEPALAGRYRLKILPTFTLEFRLGEDGRATELVLYQPNGVFTAKRKE